MRLSVIAAASALVAAGMLMGLGTTPYSAAYAQSQGIDDARATAAYEALTRNEKVTLQGALIGAGFLYQPVNVDDAAAAILALSQFQAGKGMTANGVLDDDVMASLMRDARTAFSQIGFVYRNETFSGIEIALPPVFEGDPVPTDHGAEWQAAGGDMTVSTFVVPAAERDFEDMYREVLEFEPGVGFDFLIPGRFAVSGRNRDERFIVVGVETADDTRGMTFRWRGNLYLDHVANFAASTVFPLQGTPRRLSEPLAPTLEVSLPAPDEEPVPVPPGMSPNDLVISPNAHWLVVASRHDRDVAIGLAEAYETDFPSVAVLRNTGGVYAVAVGYMDPARSDQASEYLKGRQRVPPDSFTSRHARFSEIVYPERVESDTLRYTFLGGEAHPLVEEGWTGEYGPPGECAGGTVSLSSEGLTVGADFCEITSLSRRRDGYDAVVQCRDRNASVNAQRDRRDLVVSVEADGTRYLEGWGGSARVLRCG